MATWHVSASMLRRCSNPIIKAVVLLFILSFLWLQVRIASFTPDFFKHNGGAMEELEFTFPPNLSSHVRFNLTVPENILELRGLVENYNREQKVLNSHVFGKLQPNNPVVIVQVHNRVQYLYALIESLRKVPTINKTLLVFSHDLFDRQINNLILSIDFCKVIQIFYPHSIQQFPNSFPGQDPRDCPRDLNRQEAELLGCQNSKYPDLYGHYREAAFTQTKHHWWWKLNHVMDQLNVTRFHEGPFLLIEEDHYVAPDVFHVMELMYRLRNRNCRHCNLLGLGNYLKPINYGPLAHRVEVLQWLSSKHNMGMVITRSLWRKIKRCAKPFCTFDDYNWDWSLHHVSMTCLKHPLQVMLVVSSRIFHIGECGVHHKGKDCSNSQVVQTVNKVLSDAQPFLFPKKLILSEGIRKAFKVPKGNGGWGDLRDHALCLQQVNANITVAPPNR